MAHHESHRKIIQRANRLLKQSKTLRKMSNELLGESKVIRTNADNLAKSRTRRRTKGASNTP
jgi:hypothetical protein